MLGAGAPLPPGTWDLPPESAAAVLSRCAAANIDRGSAGRFLYDRRRQLRPLLACAVAGDWGTASPKEKKAPSRWREGGWGWASRNASRTP